MTVFECLSSLEMGLIYGIVAVGVFLTFRIIDFPDLTCDGSFTFGAATAAVTLKAGFSPSSSLLLSLIAGGGAGFVTGILHVRLKVANLLSGILVGFMLSSITLKIMGGIPNIALMNERTIFSHTPALGMLLILSLCIGGGIGYLLSTDFGLALRSLGQNKPLAEIMGVHIPIMTVLALCLSNGLIGLAGGLYCHHQFFSDLSLGTGTVITGLAAVVIGEKLAPIHSLWWGVTACFLGSILYRFVIAVALHSDWLGLETSDLNLLTGIAILVVMKLPQPKGRLRCFS